MEDNRTISPSKQTQPPRRPAREILSHQISEGLNELQRSAGGLLLSGISAGLDVGFSALMIGIVLSLDAEKLPPLVREIAVAAAYSIGFIFVVIGRSSLFTEHTTLAIIPVLNGSATLRRLLRLWVLVYISNLAGGAIFAFLIAIIGPVMGTIQPDAFRQMALTNIQHPGWVILLSAVLAGWLMGLLSWLVAASRETTSQILIILLITGTIGMARLQHSIAGSIEVLSAVFAQQGVTLSDFAHFLLWTTLGNIIGGVVFVGALKYAGAVRSARESPEVEINGEN